jgi:hypothetical protein
MTRKAIFMEAAIALQLTYLLAFLIFAGIPALASTFVWFAILCIKDGFSTEPLDIREILWGVGTLTVLGVIAWVACLVHEFNILVGIGWVFAIPTATVAAFKKQDLTVYKEMPWEGRLLLACILPGVLISMNITTIIMWLDR